MRKACPSISEKKGKLGGRKRTKSKLISWRKRRKMEESVLIFHNQEI
jgi:hypothetical protein